jgi:hypothetical protein
MRVKALVMAAALLAGCGYTSRGNDMIGQAKKVNHNTPLICPDFDDVDISLGVMQNGVGSMSTQDVWLYVPDRRDYQTLKEAVQKGAIVKITYDVQRVAFCVEQHIVTGVQVQP